MMENTKTVLGKTKANTIFHREHIMKEIGLTDFKTDKAK